jgi:sigma-E factor negative regulatory protein RseC
MIEQQGEVIAAGEGQACVRLGGRLGCAACDAGRGCGAGVFGRLLRRRSVELAFENHLGVTTGEAVMVGLPEAWFLRLVARFYLYPLLTALVAAAFGHYLSGVLGTGPALSDAVTLLAAVLGGAAMLWRNREQSAAFPDAAAVQLLRVVKNHESN